MVEMEILRKMEARMKMIGLERPVVRYVQR